MPRTARASVGGICYHVLNRGNARADVFHKDGDFPAFVKLVSAANERLPMRVLAYACWTIISTLFFGRTMMVT